MAEQPGSGFNLFVYGTLRSGGEAAAMLQNAQHLGAASVGGVLYEIDGKYPALVLYGSSLVAGEVWRCAAELLPTLDEYERVSEGLFRRVGVEVQTEKGALGCWTYVAGPALSKKLVPAQRVEKWPAAH